MAERLVFIGNWDRHKTPPENGFGVYRHDERTGRLTLLRRQLQQVSVGAACLHPTQRVLYCTDETSTLPGYFQGGGGQLYALSIQPETGALTEINHCPSFGSLPSSLLVDPTGRFLAVTHHTDRVAVTKVASSDSGEYRLAIVYDDATTVLFSLGQDGSIGSPLDVFLHNGSGGPLQRQTHSQLHSVTMAPAGNFFVVCDKGCDELVCLRIDAEAQKFRLCGPPIKTPPGSSPRYVAFHPREPFLFVNHETQAIVSSYCYSEDGHLKHVITVSALPTEIKDDYGMKQSDIVVHPSGRILYSMLRGISAISIFRIDNVSGWIERIETVPIIGEGPRGCAISPDGRFLVVAALEGRIVVTYAINEDGDLSFVAEQDELPHPGSVTFS